MQRPGNAGFVSTGPDRCKGTGGGVEWREVWKEGTGAGQVCATRAAMGAGATFLRCPAMPSSQCQRRARGVTVATMSHQAVIHAYRHLYRHSLRAIQFSKPARYTLRDRLRLAFRRGSAAEYEPDKVLNTLEFLRHATRENGLEHKIVKNLLFVWWVQSNGGRAKHKTKAQYVSCPAQSLAPQKADWSGPTRSSRSRRLHTTPSTTTSAC